MPVPDNVVLAICPLVASGIGSMWGEMTEIAMLRDLDGEDKINSF